MEGWRKFSRCRPNSGHIALANMESTGRVNGIITQNVDRLHQQAGSKRVLELHGTTHEVVCLECSYRTPRDAFQGVLEELNPPTADADVSGKPLFSTAQGTPGLQRPDGDVEIDVAEAFSVPHCPKCSRGEGGQSGDGILKPDVTFFGDNVPRWRHEAANELVRGSDGLLVVGSSLMVFSAFRIAKLAQDLGIEIAVLNAGETRIDEFDGLIKHEAPIGETMTRLVRHANL